MATKPPEKNILLQLDRLELFKKEYNNERPHQDIDLNTPSELYKSSTKSYKILTKGNKTVMSDDERMRLGQWLKTLEP